MQAKPDFDVIIAGAGFSGLGMAIALKRDNLKRKNKRRFIVLEKAPSIGGTWRDNTYPGCACDIPSNLYSFSFAPNPDWSRLYPTQPEIRAYLDTCADRFDIRGHIRFNTALTRAAWDDAGKIWRIDTATGETLTARAFVSGLGGLHVPNEPKIQGRDRFNGDIWHSARWREDVALEGKSVAIIGTGASAIQIAPLIAPIAAQLDLYQRTPNWIMPKQDCAVSETTKDFYRHAPLLQEWKRRLVYLSHEARAPIFLNPDAGGAIAERIARRHIAAQIADPVLRTRVTPTYRFGCKRVLISDDFYPTLQSPNVTLITEPAAQITETGIIDRAGAARAADVIVFATGFKPLALASQIEIDGLGERKLRDDWAAGPQAYLGTLVSGYPNLFLLMGPNSVLGHNSMIYMIESQIALVMDALKILDTRGVQALNVTPLAQAAFNAEIEAKLAKTVWGTGCASWYLSPDGKNRALWPDFTFKFRSRTKRVRREDVALS